MDKEKFDLDAIQRTFTKYKINNIVDGVIVIKREDGVVFNIGGKSDAYIDKDDFVDFSTVKVGDRFKAKIINLKNEEGMIQCSKRKADKTIQESLDAEKLKLGSVFTFFITGANDDGLCSKMGEYNIFVPKEQLINTNNLKRYINKQIKGIVTEINSEEKEFIVSEKIIYEKEKDFAEGNFWKSIFINKVVDGVISNIMPYGAFVDVAGVTCFLHISDISYEKVNNINDVLKKGDELKFRVIKLDKENKKVNLGIKQLYDNPKLVLLKQIKQGDVLNGKVIKILEFGAIIECENGLTGLLHISQATNENNKNIYEIVKLGDRIKVEVISTDIEKERVSFRLI